jgi:hypothetical protein
MLFCPSYNFIPQKSDRCTLLVFGGYGKQSGHLYFATTILQLADQD